MLSSDLSFGWELCEDTAPARALDEGGLKHSMRSQQIFRIPVERTENQSI